MPDKRFVDSYNKITLDPEASARIRARLEQELLPGKENEENMINEAFGQKERLRPMRGSFWPKPVKTSIWDSILSSISIWGT